MRGGAWALCGLLSGCIFLDASDAPVASLVLDPFKVMTLPSGESFDGELAPVGDLVTFATQTPDDAGALYVTDGNATIPLMRFTKYPRGLAAIGDRVMFVADTIDRSGIWATDGTAAGTRYVGPIALPSWYHSVTAHVSGGRYYVLVQATAEVSTSDGTAEGTRPLLGDAHALDVIAGHVVALTWSPNELWATDAQGEMTRFATLPATETTCRAFRHLPDALYFNCSFGHLWRTDGTPAGTYELADHGRVYVWPVGAAAASTFYTVADEQDGPPGVWKTNGVPNDSVKLFEFFVNDVVEVGGRGVFGGENGLYTLDGRGSTKLLHRSSYTSHLEVIDDVVLFASGHADGERLSRSDGTADGLFETRLGVRVEAPQGFRRYGDLVYFRNLNSADETCRPHVCADLWAITVAELRDPK